MRLLIDSLIGLMLVGIVVGVLIHHRRAEAELDDARQVQAALDQLQTAAELHRVLEAEGDARRGYLRTVDPRWFGDAMPDNALLPDHAWIDVAPPGDTAAHPPDPVVESSDQPGFWYNPALGVFRARVPRQVSNRDTLALYNQVNTSALTALPLAADPARRPVALRPPDTTTALASPRRAASVETHHLAPPPVATRQSPPDPVILFDPDIRVDVPPAVPGHDAAAATPPAAQAPAPPRPRRTLRSDP